MTACIYGAFDARLPKDIADAVKKTIDIQLEKHHPVNLFFRADDIGVPSKNYTRMMDLFLKYRTPLCLAVVPAWMTRPRWQSMQPYVKEGGDLFCWHMHGFQHKNYQVHGKKQEFGAHRNVFNIKTDLIRGHERLGQILGRHLTRVFTPPWNRCTLDTMHYLKQMNYTAVSRSCGAAPPAPEGLQDFCVHVDLHTRKDKTAKQGWQTLLQEFSNGLGSGRCGIMIHHMRMNAQAFIFLEFLLDLLSNSPKINLMTFKQFA